MDLTDLLRRLIGVLEDLELTYMLVGSVASAFHGEPRSTQDIDVVVSLPPEQVGPLCKAFPPEEYYVSPEAVSEAVVQGGQFNVIHPGSGAKIDFMIARRDAWGQEQMARRRRVEVLPGYEGYVAAPEDVIVGKMIYYRDGGSEKHLRDIVGIMEVSAEDVDRAYIERWAARLQLAEAWRAVLRRLGDGH